MNSILTTAMTWTIGSGAGVILASQVIKAELAPLSHVSERIADATEHNAHEAARDSIETPFVPLGWTYEGGAGGVAFEISDRFAHLFAASAD